MVGVTKVIVHIDELERELMKILRSHKYNVIKIYRAGSKKHREHGLDQNYVLIIAHK